MKQRKFGRLEIRHYYTLIAEEHANLMNHQGGRLMAGIEMDEEERAAIAEHLETEADRLRCLYNGLPFPNTTVMDNDTQNPL